MAQPNHPILRPQRSNTQTDLNANRNNNKRTKSYEDDSRKFNGSNNLVLINSDNQNHKINNNHNYSHNQNQEPQLKTQVSQPNFEKSISAGNILPSIPKRVGSIGIIENSQPTSNLSNYQRPDFSTIPQQILQEQGENFIQNNNNLRMNNSNNKNNNDMENLDNLDNDLLVKLALESTKNLNRSDPIINPENHNDSEEINLDLLSGIKSKVESMSPRTKINKEPEIIKNQDKRTSIISGSSNISNKSQRSTNSQQQPMMQATVPELTQNNTTTLTTTSLSPTSNSNNSVKISSDIYIYKAKYKFEARSDSELTVQKNENLRVLACSDADGNSEWYLVANNDNEQGYVPANYLVKF